MNLNGSRPDTAVGPTFKTYEVNTFADLFCGIGGFHVAAANLGMSCVYACDIEPVAREVYKRNYDIDPYGDVASLDLDFLPYADVFFAGLPCQSFSIIGNRQAFGDHRGTLFLELAKVAAAKRPKAIVIENVRQLVTIDKGKAFECIIVLLEALGYSVASKVLNALDFGLPQKRERVFIVAIDRPLDTFRWPEGGVEMKPLSAVLEDKPHPRHYVSARIRRARKQAHTAKETPAIWHENKGGNVSSHPFSCALRAGASHNYLLVDGERRLTPRELFRLQGFPEDFELPDTDAAARRLTGNAVPVPLAQAVIKQVQSVYEKATVAG